MASVLNKSQLLTTISIVKDFQIDRCDNKFAVYVETRKDLKMGDFDRKVQELQTNSIR